MSPFARFLKQVRGQRGFRQKELAFRLGYEPSYISALERGEKAQLKNWWSGLNSGKLTWMSIPEMARYLAIKDQMAYWLCQNGYVSAEKLGTNKELGSRVRIEDVERFRQAHVYRRDIAASLRTSSKKMGNLLAEAGIFPIRGHSVMPPRLAIYPATDELRRFLADLMGVAPSEVESRIKVNADSKCVASVGSSHLLGNLAGSFSNGNS